MKDDGQDPTSEWACVYAPARRLLAVVHADVHVRLTHASMTLAPPPRRAKMKVEDSVLTQGGRNPHGCND